MTIQMLTGIDPKGFKKYENRQTGEQTVPLPEKYSEKYSVISKDQRFAGRNPQSLKLAKGVIPVTMSKLSKKINENSVKLRVNGFIKSFSPRTPNHLLDTSLFTFKK